MKEVRSDPESKLNNKFGHFELCYSQSHSQNGKACPGLRHKFNLKARH